MMSNEMDLSNWMANLPNHVKTRPINTISMPGSHDSFSYAISWRSPIGPDEPSMQIFNYIPIIGQIFKRLIYRWWVTQDTTLTEQLQLGIRYFDLRLAPYQHTIHLIHGLYAMSLTEALEEMANFLNEHSKEIILIDFQHLHKFDLNMHKYVIDKIRQVFGNKLCPFKAEMDFLTLEFLWKENFQVFVFYRSNECPNDFWGSEFLPNPWPNTTNCKFLTDFLDTNYAKGRLSNTFYVTQGVLTTTKIFCLMHFCSNLKNTLARKAVKVLFRFLKGKKGGLNGLNVVMFDFVGDSIDLIKYIILINFNALNDVIIN